MDTNTYGCVSSSNAGCDCKPKLYLSVEEEAILKELREVKKQARSLIDHLRNYKGTQEKNSFSETDVSNLTSTLDDLRRQWEHLETKLSQANESKLISLGHRDARESY